MNPGSTLAFWKLIRVKAVLMLFTAYFKMLSSFQAENFSAANFKICFERNM
jgi:hypothetical protein